MSQVVTYGLPQVVTYGLKHKVCHIRLQEVRGYIKASVGDTIPSKFFELIRGDVFER